MQKLYYSISEVSKMLDLPSHVLRYWESEFHDLKPKKNKAGVRTYQERDIELLKEIQRLVHIERFTIEGAKRELKKNKGDDNEGRNSAESTQKNDNLDRSLIEEIRKDLQDILDILG